MKIVDKIIYKKIESKEVLDDVNDFVKELSSDLENPINYLFEFYETDDVVVFVNLYAFDVNEGDTRRYFQVETATLDKSTLKLISHGDNTGFDSFDFLNNYPVWTFESLAEQGIEHGGDATAGYKYGHIEW